MPGMTRGGGGGQMMPGMGGGGGGQIMPDMGVGGSQQPSGGFSRDTWNLRGNKDKVAQLQAAVWSLQESCARGNGSACIQLKTAQQKLQQAMQQQAMGVSNAQYAADRGTVGTNGRGRTGATPTGLAQRMLGQMYGGGGGGGGW